MYIFFEHSDGTDDWKNNLDFPAKAYKRMGKTIWFAHRGFIKVWKELEPIIENAIADHNIKKIIITGYSHGAAIALLCHEYIWFNRPDLRDSTEGYGFGCPRVFWGPKTDALKRRFEKFTVIRNIDDIVTHLPPFIFGYSHVGKMLEIGKKGKYTPVEAHYAKNIQKELLLYEGIQQRIPPCYP
ncbi:MAG: lipase family protein [Clostridia bacterium]|nr:lipase family protein [Clostridia bacterium]